MNIQGTQNCVYNILRKKYSSLDRYGGKYLIHINSGINGGATGKILAPPLRNLTSSAGYAPGPGGP